MLREPSFIEFESFNRGTRLKCAIGGQRADGRRAITLTYLVHTLNKKKTITSDLHDSAYARPHQPSAGPGAQLGRGAFFQGQISN